METMVRRKVIQDKYINQDIFEKLIGYVYTGLFAGEKELTQKNIIKILHKHNICNKTIARVINELIPTAKATPNSVNSQLNQMKKQSNKHNDMLNELLSEIDKEF